MNVDSSDIIEHLPTLSKLSEGCNHITEMGVRFVVSTWAFAYGLSKGKLVSVDITNPPPERLEEIKIFCKEKEIEFEFRLEDTTKMTIEETDLLFIDTDHTYEQLKQEFYLHADKAKKYIVLHDTESCKAELWPAIGSLLSKGKWKVKEHYQNNNGLTILERI